MTDRRKERGRVQKIRDCFRGRRSWLAKRWKKKDTLELADPREGESDKRKGERTRKRSQEDSPKRGKSPMLSHDPGRGGVVARRRQGHAFGGTCESV